MRRWYHPNPGPDGEPVAPDQSGSGRHDTLVDAGSQTDAFPQKIRPRYYNRFVGGSSIFSKLVRYPHPLLCGSSGPLTYLPDHMHEGHCEVPSDLTASFTFDGVEFDEYPEKNGARLAPEVIAWATNTVTNDEFGVVAAYDGHRADVGRVVVDATWHHWFNINVLPYKNASDPAHASYEPSVVPKFEAMKEYWRNVAVWLAKPTIQTCIRNGGWIRVIGYPDIAITYRKLDSIRDLNKYYWQLGSFAKDALGKSASQCQRIIWLWKLLQPVEEPNLLFPFKSDPDSIDPVIDFDFTELETVALGAAVHEAFDQFSNEDQPERLLEDNGEKFENVMRAAAQKGVKSFIKQREVNFKKSTDMLKRL